MKQIYKIAFLLIMVIFSLNVFGSKRRMSKPGIDFSVRISMETEKIFNQYTNEEIDQEGSVYSSRRSARMTPEEADCVDLNIRAGRKEADLSPVSPKFSPFITSAPSESQVQKVLLRERLKFAKSKRLPIYPEYCVKEVVDRDDQVPLTIKRKKVVVIQEPAFQLTRCSNFRAQSRQSAVKMIEALRTKKEVSTIVNEEEDSD